MAGTPCPSCATLNPAEARFCMACGTALPRSCPTCGEPAPAEARFCMSCRGAPRAALGMQAAMDEINADIAGPYDVSLALRVGVNTGDVLAGAVGESYTVIGDTVNVAARLQAAARPGSVTVGARTFRDTRGAIAYEE